MKWLAVFGHWDAFSHTPNCGRGLNHWTLNFAQFWPGFLKRVDSEDIVVDFETSFRLRRNGDKTIPGLKHSFWQWTQCQRLLTRGCVNLIVNCKLTRGCVRSIYKWIKSHHHGRLLIAGQVKTIHLSCLISQQLGRRSFSHQSEDCKFSGQNSWSLHSVLIYWNITAATVLSNSVLHLALSMSFNRSTCGKTLKRSWF